MSRLESLGITRLESLHFYARYLERTRHFLTGQLGFGEIGRSGAALEEAGRQTSRVFQAGDVRMVVSAPTGPGGRAWRWLRKHPEGVGTIVFAVEDIERTFKLIEERGGTAMDVIQRYEDDGGSIAMFSITTPFGGTTFRFVQEGGYHNLYPGFERYDTPTGGTNPYGFTGVDHVTSNFETMKPALLWMEHVMGFEEYWEVEFHTVDVAEIARSTGSGLRSKVMHDPHSGLKFANNEPYRPHFKDSQINVFAEDHRGDGVQHAALLTDDILATVRKMRGDGITFMPTPGTYYDMLPERLRRIGVNTIDEDHAVLRELEILVDGSSEHAYMLQIFLREAAAIHGDPEAGPFFFEIIERKGDRGFGAGNFRALFESIERQQRADGKIG